MWFRDDLRLHDNQALSRAAEATARGRCVKETLASQGITATSSPGFILVEPWEVTNGQGRPYKVFTPFSKAVASQVAADEPEGVPDLGRRQAVHLPGPNPPSRHGRHPWPNTGRPARPGRASD